MSEKLDFQNLFKSYGSSPDLYILDGAGALPDVAWVERVASLKPSASTDIALASIISMLAENVSHERVNEGGGTVIMRKEFVEEAQRRVVEHIRTAPGNTYFVEQWKAEVVKAFTDLATASPETPTEEAIRIVSERFRVPSVAMIRFVSEMIGAEGRKLY